MEAREAQSTNHALPVFSYPVGLPASARPDVPGQHLKAEGTILFALRLNLIPVLAPGYHIDIEGDVIPGCVDP